MFFIGGIWGWEEVISSLCPKGILRKTPTPHFQDFPRSRGIQRVNPPATSANVKFMVHPIPAAFARSASLAALLSLAVLGTSALGASNGSIPKKDPKPSLTTASATSEKAVSSEKTATESPNYPRKDSFISYTVDPNWPQKAPGIEWRQVPGVAVDPSDNVWVFTRAETPVQVYSPEGKLIRSWGKGLVKTAHHIKLDTHGNVWIADSGLHTIRKFTREGELLLTLGTPQTKGEDDSHFWMPTDMAFAKNGDILVSDGYGNSRVVRYDSNGKFLSAWGTMGTGPREFSLPHAIAIDSRDRVYVADRNNARIQVYSSTGDLLDSWTNLIIPWGFWIDANDDLWVCGSSPMTWSHHPKQTSSPLGVPPKDQIVMRFNTSGKLLQLWTFPKAEDGKEKPGDLNWVHGIALDSKGNLYLGDIIGKRIQKFTRHAPQ